jgi:hypothetical protein
MLKLYRSAIHTNQWIAHSPDFGWVVFPARENGWHDRRPARGVDPMYLREVPARMAFNTGLLEEVELETTAA